MNLNELRDKAYKIACEHGFHDNELSKEHCLMLVITELSEAVEADRKGKNADVAKFKEWQGNSVHFSDEMKNKRFKEDFEAYIKDSVADELADAAIRLLDLAGLRKVNVEIQDDEWESLTNDLKTDAKNQYNFSEAMFHICESIIDKNRYDHSEDVILIPIGLIKLVCHIYDIDLEWHIKMKMEYNSLRENKHGKKY